MLPINDNSIDLSKYRGRIQRCPDCTISNRTKEQADAVRAERVTLGRACTTCLGHGFVAVCTNCNGTGIYKGSAVAFGGGDNPHQSACNPCGASGYFAVRRPADWKDDEPAVQPDAQSVAQPVASQEVVAPATPAV